MTRKSLNIKNILQNKKYKIISTEDSLKDVIPIKWRKNAMENNQRNRHKAMKQLREYETLSNWSDNFNVIKVNKVEEATHWIALEDKNNEFIDVTIGQCYRLLYDKFDEEYIIIDDEGVWSLNYLCHHGYFARLEEKEEYQIDTHNEIIKIIREMREHKKKKVGDYKNDETKSK